MKVEYASRAAQDLAKSLAGAAEIAASRERVRSRLLGRERTVTLALASGFAVAAVACAAFLPAETSFSPWVAALLVVLYAALAQVEFEIGPGSAVPTELVLVPMLFLLPPGAVPACVAAGLFLGGFVERVRSRRHGQRMTVLLASAWHSVGPAIVVGLLAGGSPQWEHVPVYVLALASQFTFDAGAVLARHHLGRGVPVAELVPTLAWVALVDVALAPVALAVAFAAEGQVVAVLCVLPLAGLFQMLGAERRRRIDESLVLGQAVEDAHRTARLDPLTGIGNRLAWQEAIENASARLAAAGVGSSVLLVDLNGLKEANDTHGHHVGDRLIQLLALTLRRTVADVAELARIGGDEFALVAVGMDERGCAELVARIDRALAGLDADGVPLSASLGAASSPPCTSIDDALRVADQRLYSGKRSLKGST